MEFKVTLPWYSQELSPNSRKHWAVVSRAKRQHKELANIYTRNANVKFSDDKHKVFLNITYCPPSKRRYDLDNCLASSKAYIDGISQAIGIDDSRFAIQMQMSEDTFDGSIRVTIS